MSTDKICGIKLNFFDSLLNVNIASFLVTRSTDYLNHCGME